MVGYQTKKADLRSAALAILAAATAFLWLAVLSGQLEEQAAREIIANPIGHQILVLHTRIGYFSAILWSALLLSRLYLIGQRDPRWLRPFFAFAVIACLLVLLNAFLGGRLVYQFGAGVGRHRLSASPSLIQPILLYHFPIPNPRLLDNPFLCEKVHIHDPEPFTVSIPPFKVVHQ